jgi:hypothetical protein
MCNAVKFDLMRFYAESLGFHVLEIQYQIIKYSAVWNFLAMKST